MYPRHIRSLDYWPRKRWERQLIRPEESKQIKDRLGAQRSATQDGLRNRAQETVTSTSAGAVMTPRAADVQPVVPGRWYCPSAYWSSGLPYCGKAISHPGSTSCSTSSSPLHLLLLPPRPRPHYTFCCYRTVRHCCYPGSTPLLLPGQSLTSQV